MHHVMNRGLAKRAVFRDRAEVRYFLSRLAREVRVGRLRVHELAVLTTHFHLLVESPLGELSEAMRRVENPFVRWFNRRSRRDGPLFRGRFTSRRVEGERYRENVRRYIVNNPVSAGLALEPSDYPFSSASLRATGRPPLWLAPAPDGGVDVAPSADATWVVERLLEDPKASCAFDDLVGAAPASVRSWMERKALLAEGRGARACIVSPAAIDAALAAERSDDAWLICPGSRGQDGWRVLRIGLSHEAAALSMSEIALDVQVSRSTVGLAVQQHRRLVLADEEYRERATRVLHHALTSAYGPVLPSDNRVRIDPLADRS